MDAEEEAYLRTLIAVIIFAGRPLTIDWAYESADGFLARLKKDLKEADGD